MGLHEEIESLLAKVRKEKPLVHHITNYVTANDCANITLAIGASPVMADDLNEVVDMTRLSSSLVINIGTLNSKSIESMILAGTIANKENIPVILDPVGIGATNFRREIVKRLLNRISFSVIKGNMSEIKILSGIDCKMKGVDSEDILQGGEDIALNLSQRLNTIIVITGAKDIISDGNRTCLIENGNKLMTSLTGTGCMTGSLIGAYSGVTKDYYISSIAGVCTMGLAGEKAYKSLGVNEGIGSFKVKLFDNIFNLLGSDFIEGGKLIEF